MHRHLIAIGTTVTALAVMMPSAAASHGRNWSAPVNVGGMINTGSEEAGPAISHDGLALYFQSNRPGGVGTGCDIWVAVRETVHDEWNFPENLGPAVNTAECENSVSLSADEHHLFFSRPPGDVWVSYRRDLRDHLGWGPGVRLGPAINSDVPDSTARHFVSRKYGLSQLYFFSARPGGLGGPDIWVADAFGAARPVEELNSPAIEGGAVLSRNGLEIFFHSTRPGVGVRDLWTSRRDSVLGPWELPENMVVLNTTDEDFFPAVFSDDTLFFTSNRGGGFGGTDIYMTTRAKHIDD